jgi:hypothetical protein
VSFSQASPLSGNDSTTTVSEFGSIPAVHENSHAHRNIVSPGFFGTLGSTCSRAAISWSGTAKAHPKSPL